MTDSSAVLNAKDIRKSYGGVMALKGVDFGVRAGTVHALLGENGAGKSTLIKVLVGATRPDTGTIWLDRRNVRFANTAEATRQGIAVVSQELSLFPHLDALSNLFVMRERCRGPFVARQEMVRLAEPVLDELGLHVNIHDPVSTLTLAQRQLLEIARALLTQPRVLILDEPTSALHARETEQLFKVLRTLRQRNVAVIYVSHILEDVLNLCDEVTILRDGKRVLSAEPTTHLHIDEIVHIMLGEKAPELTTYRALDTGMGTLQQQKVLSFQHVQVPGRLEDVTIEVPAGSIVGVAGLADSGHLAVLELVAGIIAPQRGEVRLPNGDRVRPHQRGAVQQGIALIPGDRRRIGLMLDKPVWENIAQVRAFALARDGYLLNIERLRTRARAYITQLGIKTSSIDQAVGRLSGGNQQKVVFAKWLEARPTVLLLDDPTRGIDVGARADIYALMRGLARGGAVQLLASTDPKELATVCDRVHVFYNGSLCATLAPPMLDSHIVLEVMNTGQLPV
jgi:ABC-type sugar transport system ATPase subunit